MEWKVGDRAELTRLIDDDVVHQFADAVGDHNPIHIDDEAANHSIFRRRIAHGMITASMISAVIGTQLPGPGSIYMSQTLQFVAPVYVGETVTATVTIKSIRSDKPIFTLETVAKKADGQVVVTGEAAILYRKPKAMDREEEAK